MIFNSAAHVQPSEESLHAHLNNLMVGMFKYYVKKDPEIFPKPIQVNVTQQANNYTCGYNIMLYVQCLLTLLSNNSDQLLSQIIASHLSLKIPSRSSSSSSMSSSSLFSSVVDILSKNVISHTSSSMNYKQKLRKTLHLSIFAHIDATTSYESSFLTSVGIVRL